MGFKVDSSFLRFLTMGALGARQTQIELRDYGFEPIELERYCTSNKIWATKVKRLRLPDLLCVRTGLRVEVRAKSKLTIRMSDAPNNPDRVWDAGLRNNDLVALIACADMPEGPVPADHSVYFTVEALRASVGRSKLGLPKSASEGAERDRTWPATIPKRPGTVLSVNDTKLVVMMRGDGAPARKQTYTLNGKRPYVSPGDTFAGETTILAGVPDQMADLSEHLANQYDPFAEITSANPVDRYAGAKALLYRDDLRAQAPAALEASLSTEQETRVALEMAGTAAALQSRKGQDHLARTLWSGEQPELSMEAILILTELQTDFARKELVCVAGAEKFAGDERRQTAVWGLGKTGLCSYKDLIPFIADPEDNVAYHAITAFGTDSPRPVIEELIGVLTSGDTRRAAAASEALRVIGNDDVLSCLVDAAICGGATEDWVLATLGRLNPDVVRTALAGTPLLDRLAPMLLIARGANWLAREDAVTDLAFLLKQNL